MTVLDGQITEYGLYGQGHPESDWSDDLKSFDDPVYFNLSTAQPAELTLHEQRTEVYPDEFSRVLNGQITHFYQNDYYHRIHIKPNPLALGDLLSEETREVYVWNAFFETKTLDDVTEENADGIDVEEPVSTPYDFAPLKEQTYTINISTTGPPTIDADVNFEFTVYTVTLDITGSRVTLFVWQPQHKYTEELQWLTNILRTRKGEQRIALRVAPRQIFNYSFLEDPQEISKIKVITDNWNFCTWGLPVWKEMTTGIDASSGDTAINFDTSYADYQEDGLAVLWESPDKAHAVRITNVRSDGIDIDPELEDDWSDAIIMPLRKAITPEGFEFSRGERGKYTRLSATFIVTDNEDLSETGDYDTYREYDVLTDGNIIIGDMSERIHRPLVQIDNGQGPITIETTQDYSKFARTVGKFTKTMAALWQWRKWLHARRGKQKAFWLPSWNEDITLAKTIEDNDTEIEIEPFGLATHGDFPLDCMMMLNDGTVFYRRITAATELSGGNEQITIDSDLEQEVQPGDIDLWCFMDLVRFNTDSVELEHQNPYIMKTSIPVMRVPE